MAETEQEERTEQPTPRRLQQARERGQIPRSRELGNFATMIGGSTALVALGSWSGAHIAQIMRQSLTVSAAQLADPRSILAALGAAAAGSLQVMLPVFGAVAIMMAIA